MRLGRTLLRPLGVLARTHTTGQLRKFLSAHKDSRSHQDMLLTELIAFHRQTAFGKDHGFGRLRSYEDFKAAVPVRSYEALKPYMQRVFNGEPNALLPANEPVLMFAQTSGTTGTPKNLPVTRRFLKEMRRGFNIFGMRVLQDHPAAWLRPILTISSPMCEATSPMGLPCGAISGLLAATQMRLVRKMYAVKPCIGRIADSKARYYANLRCAVERDVAIITTPNPSSTIKLIETGQQNVERLIRDVAEGTINPPAGLPSGLAKLLRFRPNRSLARRLEEGLKRDGQLLPRHFWNVVFLTNWTGGTLKLYLPRLKELFGDVPVRDMGLLASEGRFSVPLEDNTPAGVAEITGNFLEFIPVDQVSESDPQTLRAHELTVGGEYFLVITNWAGLWRYSIDDRVRVVDYLGQSPVFEFLSRGLHTSSITGEKITEHQVVEAMRLASERAGLRIERFILQGLFSRPPFYELRIEAVEGLDAEGIAEYMDSALCKLNIEYQSKRESGRLGPIRAESLPAGSLEKAEADKIHSRGGKSEQYKHQYLLTEVLQKA